MLLLFNTLAFSVDPRDPKPQNQNLELSIRRALLHFIENTLLLCLNLAVKVPVYHMNCGCVRGSKRSFSWHKLIWWSLVSIKILCEISPKKMIFLGLSASLTISLNFKLCIQKVYTKAHTLIPHLRCGWARSIPISLLAEIVCFWLRWIWRCLAVKNGLQMVLVFIVEL